MDEVIVLDSDSSDTIITPLNSQDQEKDASFEDVLKRFDEIDNILKKFTENNIQPTFTSSEECNRAFSSQSPKHDLNRFEISSSDEEVNNIPKVKPISQSCKVSSKDESQTNSTNEDLQREPKMNVLKQHDSGYTDTPSSSSEECSKSFSRQSSKYDLDNFDDDITYSPLKKRIKECVGFSTETLGQKKINSKNKESAEEKNRLKELKEAARLEKIKEKARKKEELQREKALKQAMRNADKNLKPDQALKNIVAHIDEKIIKQDYAKDISACLANLEITYTVETQVISSSITWTRKVQSHLISDEGKLTLSKGDPETDQILFILNWKEVINHISSNSFITYVQSLKSICQNKKLFFGVFGLQRYFNYQKNVKQSDFRNNVADVPQQTNVKDERMFTDVPMISKKEVDNFFVDLQVLCSLTFRRLETPQELGLFIAQFSKSVALLPYKLEKQEKHMQADWYMSGENKDCVRVDKDGNGLSRLWRQQLTTFPLARLETAEAIVQNYTTPTFLVEAYQTCQSEEEAGKLLQDIPIRRAAGPLTSVRKIGPELSKKVHKFFTSLDGDLLL